MTVDPGFRDFYEREFRAVFRAALLLCGDWTAAEDVTQEAFVRALEHWDRLADQPWAGGWTMSTAINLGKRALRRRTKPETREGASLPDLDMEIDLWNSVRTLPRRQQQAILLYYGADLSVQDTATAMRCREGTARAHLSRARKSLEKRLRGATDGVGRASTHTD